MRLTVDREGGSIDRSMDYRAPRSRRSTRANLRRRIKGGTQVELINEDYTAPIREAEDYLFVSLSNGLIQAFAFSFLGFEFIAVFWVILEKFGALTNTLPYAGVLDISIGFIIGFVYNLWITKALRGYVAPAQQYQTLLLQISSFAHMIFTLIHAHRQMALQGHLRGVTDEDVRFTEKELRKLNELLQALVYLAEKLFGPNEYHHSPTLVFDYYGEYTFIRGEKRTSPEHLMLSVQSEILTTVKGLVAKGVLSESDAGRLYTAMDPIAVSIQSIGVSQTVHEPPHFMNHVWVVLLVYFVVLFPYRIVVQAGMATLFIYPTASVLLTGFVIIRKWLKSSFDSSRPWKANDCESWCDTCRSEIGRLSRIVDSEDAEMLVVDNRHYVNMDELALTTTTTTTDNPSSGSNVGADVVDDGLSLGGARRSGAIWTQRKIL